MTDAERLALARRFALYEVAPDMCAEYQALDEDGRRDVLTLSCYMIQQARERQAIPAQRRAMRLFRSWLTAEQLAQYRRRGYVIAIGSAGGRYRIHPGSAGRMRSR